MPSDPSRTTRSVLCVLADATLRESIRAPLSAAGWQVVEASCVLEALSVSRAQRPDIVVLECGIEGARQLIDQMAGRAVPLIAVGSAESCQRAVSAGAVDWIVPPVTGELLVHRVEAVLRAALSDRELVGLRAQFTAEDGGGEATPAATPRESFLRRADAILRDPRQRGDNAAMLVLSVEIADHGAEPGALAACLPTLARRLSDALPAGAGDGADGRGVGAPLSLSEGCEFAVLLARQERTQAFYKVARRIQQELEVPVELDNSRRFPVRVDTGIAVHPENGAAAIELFEAARQSMGRARQEQLHGIRFATAAMNASTFERLTLESSLRLALEREELTLFYQPRIELATGRIVCMEALLRWRHPELGLVSPSHFVPIAEESGLIVPIGEWVLREACRQNQAWRAAGLPAVRMAVNLSSVQFRQPDLEVRIARVLEESGLEPEALELELTESLLLKNAEVTIETLRTIKSMGIHLSIDDFGTGYSSLSYIKRFPVDALKIDQSFVREMTTSPESAAITTSIVLMGKSLGLTVVAEGVETRSQLEFLRALECDEAQGYLFCRPVPPKEAGDHLKSGPPNHAPTPATHGS